MCMGGCGGAKKASPKKQTTSKPVSKKSVKTNWSTGFGSPKVKFSFGGSRGR